MTKICGLGTLKGGAGKTMMAYSIGGHLAYQKKKRVLLLDADPQCNLTFNCGVDTTDFMRPSIVSILDNGMISPEEVILESVIPGVNKLDLIPSNILLTETEMNLVSRSNRENLLKNWIMRNEDFLSKYDYIICDTNPSMGLINQNVFVACDSIILVTDVGMNGVQGALQFCALWERRRFDLGLEDNIKALIINDADKRLKLSRDILEYCKEGSETLGSLIVEPIMPSRVAMKNSENVCQPISVQSPKSEEAEAIKKIIKSLEKKGAL